MSSTPSANDSAGEGSPSSTSSRNTASECFFSRDLATLVDANRRFVRQYGVNIFDNYAYREYLVVDAISAMYGPCKKLPGRSGFDAFSETLGNIEIKTTNIKSAIGESSLNRGFQFDKQNDPQRRERTGAMDALALALFSEDRLGVVAMVFDIESLRSLIRRKQDAFLEKMEACRVVGKRLPRDTISVSMRDLRDHGVAHDVLASAAASVLFLNIPSVTLRLFLT